MPALCRGGARAGVLAGRPVGSEKGVAGGPTKVVSAGGQSGGSWPGGAGRQLGGG
jgi:hypothetical protein